MKNVKEISKCYVVYSVSSIKSQQFREDNKEEKL